MRDADMPSVDTDTLVRLAQSGLVAHACLARGRYVGLDLSGVRFEAVDAKGAVFEDCALGQSIWQECRLDDTRFERVDLAHSRFMTCSGTGLRFAESNLADTWWQDCNFMQVDFSSSCLDGMAASSCDFASARAPQRLGQIWLSACRMPDLTLPVQTQWHQVQVLDSRLGGCDLSGAVLTQCAFVRSVLDGLHAVALRAPYLSFWQCSARGANLSHAQLEGANFQDADLTEANFTSSNLQRSRLVRARTGGAKFIGANLSQADASHLQAGDADFSRSQLDLVNVHDARLDLARWDGCDLSRLRQTDPVLLQAQQWCATKH